MIDFDLTEEQQMIRDTVGAFAREEIRPAARPADESGDIPAALIAKIAELGLVRGALPESVGGDGAERSAVTGAIVAEELAYGDLAIAIHCLAPRLLAYPILEMGTDAQRARILKPLAASGFVAATAALMEPRWDFGLTDLQTSAKRDGANWIVSGAKCGVPLAAESETILVYAKSGAGEGFTGVEAFIVPRTSAGVTLGDREKSMGLKALATYEVQLKDVKLGAEARVGGDKGINYSRLMSESRVGFGAMAVGVMRAAFEYTRDYAKERKAFGVPIATKQAIAFMIADMAIEIDAARLLLWEAAAQLDKGADALEESYLAKNYAAASALRVADNAVQALGGHGYIREHPVEMWFRNARGFSALDGLATV
ncbi:MAG TPA: acyl-CoA dehydrogenase family protein [Candidatus Binataceae bacterium]|nr:acyl-CoA dehydrogenase family protein [Candidatus Binataceae bacterium]